MVAFESALYLLYGLSSDLRVRDTEMSKRRHQSARKVRRGSFKLGVSGKQRSASGDIGVREKCAVFFSIGGEW